MKMRGPTFPPACAPLLAAALTALCPAPTAACNVPVFRYALERWAPEPYELVAFHGRAEAAAAAKLQAAATATNANLQVFPVDVSAGVPADWRAYAATNGFDASPRLALRYPQHLRDPTAADTVWSAPFTPANVRRLLDSPARRRIARNIAAGDVAVWVFVPGPHHASNRAARARLDAALADFVKLANAEGARTAKVNATPEERAVDPDAAREISIEARFSVIEVAANDPDEAVLVAMLRHIEPDLNQHTDKPMAFPVYGQGRALFGLIGLGIAAQQVGDTCHFLFGDCSCTIKEQNPGLDLLIAADWARAVAEPMVTDEPMPALTGVTPDAPASGGSGADARAEAPSEPPPTRRAGWLWPAAAAGLLALAGVAIVSVRLARRGRN
jgi:hypothetical protein